MNRVVAVIVAILMAVAVPGFAVADDGTRCERFYPPVPKLLGPTFDSLVTLVYGDRGGMYRQWANIAATFQWWLIDRAAIDELCAAPGPGRSAADYAEGVKRGSGASMVHLAVMTATGDGVRADPAGAVALFRRGLLRVFAAGVRDWSDALQVLQLTSLPPVLEAQRAWGVDAAKIENPRALDLAGKFLEPGPAADPMAACLYLDRQSRTVPAIAFALYHMVREQPGRLPVPAEAADVWLDRSLWTGQYDPALAEVGRRLLASDQDIDQFTAITYLAAAQKAGEDVGDLLQQAIRGHPKFYIEGALRGIDHRPTGWQPSASVSPDLIRQPCSPRPATP